MAFRVALFLALVLVVSVTPATASYESGLYAYSAGDYETARREWAPLAKAGDARSQYQLGMMYFKGEGAGVDNALAFKWLRQAADQDYTPALFGLAEMYYTGRGVAHSHGEAARLYAMAAKSGNAEAQFALGALHIRGHGVEKDLVAAHMWLSLAGMRGLKYARMRRDEIEAMMTPAQIVEAEKLRQEQMSSN